jgi:hypothetical protein
MSCVSLSQVQNGYENSQQTMALMFNVRSTCVSLHVRWRYTRQFATAYRGKVITELLLQKKQLAELSLIQT